MNIETDFNFQTLQLADDYEGKVTATLVSANANSARKKAVLYVHGFIDYFFQAHVAEKFLTQGFDFYALDLRKYGRSILPHQHPNFCQDISEYFEEISIALSQIYGEQKTEITLLGHSTGGLIAAAYMNNGTEKEKVKNVVLNSPFLDFYLSEPLKFIGWNVARLGAKILPYGKLNNGLPPSYPESIHQDYQGEWDFNLNWKPIQGFPTLFKWVLAIYKAQQNLNHSKITVPVLLLHSHRSLKMKKFKEAAHSADIVLNVEHMKKIGPKLGKNVTLIEIQNGMHDLFLSKKAARETAFEEMFRWLSFQMES
ncbi:MAG: alpha/beta hydrolase [Crocinitomicaceae bacterium]